MGRPNRDGQSRRPQGLWSIAPPVFWGQPEPPLPIMVVGVDPHDKPHTKTTRYMIMIACNVGLQHGQLLFAGYDR